MSGRVRGALVKRNCPAPIGSTNAENVSSITYLEKGTNSSNDIIKGMWCHPISSGSGYDKGKGYPAYPQCYTDGKHADGDKYMAVYDKGDGARCIGGKGERADLKWENQAKAGNNRFAYSDPVK